MSTDIKQHIAQGTGSERGNGTHGTHGTGGIAAEGTGMSAGTGPAARRAQGAEEGAARRAQGAEAGAARRAQGAEAGAARRPQGTGTDVPPWEVYGRAKPWEVFRDDKLYEQFAVRELYRPSVARRVSAAFASGDPLAFIDNPNERMAVQRATDAMADGESYRKRMAVAAYFVSRNPGSDYRFVISNLDSILEQHYGIKTSPDQAYQRLADAAGGRNMQNVQESSGQKPGKFQAVPAIYGLDVQDSSGFPVLHGMIGAAWYGLADYERKIVQALVSGGIQMGESELFQDVTHTVRSAAQAGEPFFIFGQHGRNGQVYEQLSPEQKKAVKEYFDIYRQQCQEPLKQYQAMYHPGDPGKDTLGSLWQEGRYGDVSLKGLAICYDQLATSIFPMMLTGWLAGPAGATGAFAGAMVGEGQDAVLELKPDASPEEISAYAMRHAAYEVIPEYFFGWIPILKAFKGKERKAVIEHLKSAWKDYAAEFVKSGFKDTFGELITFGCEKAEDALNGLPIVNGRTFAELSPEEQRAYLMDGLAETIVGSFFTAGAGGAFARYGQRGAIARFNEENERFAVAVNARVSELEKKDVLSADEAGELSELTIIQDSGDIAQYRAATARMILAQGAGEGGPAEHIAQGAGSERGNGTHGTHGTHGTGGSAAEGTGMSAGTGPVTENGAQGAEEGAGTGPVTENGAQGAEEGAEEGEDEDAAAVDSRAVSSAAERTRLRAALPFDPEETRARVIEAAQTVRVPVLPVDSWTREQLAPLRARYDEDYTDDQLQAAVPALWQGGVCYINIHNVAPSDVPLQIAHEALGHEGIRRVFGDEAANLLFDTVWQDCHGTAEMDKILDLYRLGKPGEDLTLAEQREAAEEFLAHLQEVKDADGKRPGWFRQLIAKVRLWLRQHGFMVHHLSDDDLAGLLARAANAAKRNGQHGQNGQNGQVRYDVDRNGIRSYYQVPFADGLKRAVDPAQKENRAPVFVSETPEVLQKIGFTALPMMMNARHLRLNYYTKSEFENKYGKIKTQEHAHGLYDRLKSLPKALEHPLAVVANMTPNAKPGSVVAITDMDVNGQKVVVPVLIEANNNVDGEQIDSHLVLTVYDSSDWVNTFLTPAIKAEKNGIGIFYFDKEKAARYSALSKKEGAIPTGFVHNIAQAGINVKPQTETLQFKRWFGDSKVVDDDGEPMVVYRRDNTDFSVFDINETQKTDAGFLGKGFYFYGDKAEAERPGYGKNLRAFYLEAENPYYISQEEVNELANANDKEKSAEFVERLKEEGYDSVYWNGDLRQEWMVFYPTQIKSAADNIGTFDRKNPDIRYRTALSQADQDLVTMMKPLVGQFMLKSDEEYAALFKSRYGVEINPAKVHFIAYMACSENKRAAARKQWRDAYEFYRSENPVFDFVLNFAGEDPVIRPSDAHLGEEFSGSFISPAFVKHSMKRPQGKKESEKVYKKYLAKRDAAIAGAEGIASDELARAYARQTGMDEAEAEGEILDFFRHLKKTDIRAEYSSFRKDSFARTKAEEQEAGKALADAEQDRIQEEVTQILSSGEAVVNDVWAKENRPVYNELYRALFHKEPPYVPGKGDMEAMNAALIQQSGDAAKYAAAYKAARAAAQSEALQRIADFRKRLREGRDNAVKLQREADAFLKAHLPIELRSRYTGRILELMQMEDGARRQAAFDQLCRDIVDQKNRWDGKQLRDQLKVRLDQLGRRTDTGRKAVGVRDEETQQTIDEIRRMAELTGDEVAAEVSAVQTAIEMAESNGEPTADLTAKMVLLECYGDLFSKNPEDLAIALKELNRIAREGRGKFFDMIHRRAAHDAAEALEIVQLVTGGKTLSDRDRVSLRNQRERTSMILKKFKETLFNDLNLWGIFDALDLTTGAEMRDNAFYRFAQMTHKVARDCDTIKRHNADDFNRAFDRIFRTSGGMARAQKILELRKVVKNSGVFRIWPDPNEDRFEYDTLPVEEARKLLAEFDAAPDGAALKSYEAEAIRHQLRMLDRHITLDSVKSEDGVTDKLLKAYRAEVRQNGGKADRVVVPRPVFQGTKAELELTQLQALYLHLLWNQPSIQYKMLYNGYTGETMQQIEKFLSPEVKKLGSRMVSQLEADHGRIDEVYRKLYFTAFPQEKNYFPAYFGSRINRMTGQEVDMSRPGEGARPLAYSPGALKLRIFHLAEPEICDALTLFQNHRLQMAHFVTHGEAARQIRAVFLNKEVRQAISDMHGDEVYKALIAELRCFINGGNADAEANAYYQMLYSSAVRAKMALNLTSGIKQTLGVITFVQEIPAKELASGLAYAYSHPREVFDTLWHTDYIQNRWKSGANRELRMLLDPSGNSAGRMGELMRKSDTLCSLPLRLGDMGASLFGGYAVYQYHLKNFLKQGMPEAEAKEAALLEMEMAIERTQQSSQIHMLTHAQKSAWRIFATFKSNQILLWNRMMPRIWKGDWKGAMPGAAALVLSSLAMSAFGEAMKHGSDFDKREFTETLWAILDDALAGAGAWGTAFANGIEQARHYGRSGDLLVGDIGNAFRYGTNLPKDLHRGDDEKVWRDVNALLTAAGYFFEPLSAPAAASRESLKWVRMINGASR